MYYSGHCRLCAGVCGVVAQVEGDRLVALHPDREDPVSLGQPCAVLDRSLEVREGAGRIHTPQRRDGEQLVPCSWDEALAGIGDALGAVRSKHGPRALGLFLGPGLHRRSTALLRSLALGVAWGTPHLFSEAGAVTAPMTRMAELMLGHASWLLPDVGRAHYVLLFGDHDDASDWSPALRGRCHLPELRHSQKTKGTKLVCVGPRRSPLADEATQHVAIRPGTEGVFLLGMLVAAVRGGWGDDQYLRDYAEGVGALEGALSRFSVDSCASVCGVPAATLSGVALKFSRSAMSVAVPGPGTFTGQHGGLAAWAWLALHTLTANTLRPGGLYDHEPLIDIQALASTVPTDLAPTANSGAPLHLLQLPGDQLGPNLEGEDGHRVHGLVVVDGDPAETLPGSPRVRAGLEGLDCLVVLASHESATTAQADWVLPIAHPWEESELELAEQPLLPRQILRHSAAFVPPIGESRPAAEVLAALHGAVHAGLRGSVFGVHLGLLARASLSAKLDEWLGRVVDWGVDGVPDEGLPPGTSLERGASDRALWRVGRESDRIVLLPDAVRAALSAVDPSALGGDLREAAARPFVLWTTRRLDRSPDLAHRSVAPGAVVLLHPDAGFQAGDLVKLETAVGGAAATVALDDRLRPDVACVPVESEVDGMALLSLDALDPLLHTAVRDGLRCAVTPA